MPANRSLVELDDFLKTLRVNGIPVGAREIDHLRQVFALAPHLDRQDLQSLLRATLIKTPQQHQVFTALFADWCPDHETDWQATAAPPTANESVTAPELFSPRFPSSIDESSSTQRRFIPRPIGVLLAGLALLALLLWGLWPRPTVITPPSEPEDTIVRLPRETSPRPDELPAAPVANVWFWQAHVEPFTVPRRLKPVELAALGLLPWALALLVWYRYQYATQEIKPHPGRFQGHGWQPLPPPGRDDSALLAAPERRQMVWNIEHFLADDPTRRLHLPHTVEATARSGGFVQLRFQPAVYDRSIWFWLDRQLERTTPRAAVQQLIATLQAAGLEARQGLFTDVPEQVDWPAQTGYKPEHEEGHGRQAVVVIFTDGAGLAQRLEHPLTQFATQRLLRALQHWPRLCFVDCASTGGNLRALLAPYRLATISLEEVPAWLGGVAAQDSPSTTQTLYGDARAWAGAVALGGARVEAASANTLRVVLGLQGSPWQSERILDDVADPAARKRHINWLLGCETPGEDGLPATTSLVRRALTWWQQRYQQAAQQMQAQENPLLSWHNSLASRRWQVEQALLQLYLDPAGALRPLARLASAELRDEIRARLSDFAAAEHAEYGRNNSQVIYLPWRFDKLPVMTRYQLRRLGFAGKVYPQEAVAPRRAARLVLAVTMLGMLGLAAWGSALYHWLTPQVPSLLVQESIYEHPVLVAQTIRHRELLGNGDYQITLGSARHTLPLPPVPAGAVVPVRWHWQEKPNAIALHGNTILRAGRLAQPIRACSRDWPQRSLVVIAAEETQEAARQLAIRLLDKGSADQVLLGERWAEALPEWLGSSPALNRQTQVLVVLPEAAGAEAAVARMAGHPGPWAVVVSGDFAGVAHTVDFAGSQVVEQVKAPWRVQRSQGRVLVYGGPERQAEGGITWVQVCPGTFTMGRLKGEDAIAENAKNETERQWYQREIVEPQRTIVLSAFQMAATETTRQQYGEQGQTPKVDIDWADARAFCQKVGGDLPTEAQWEYAARGGSRFPWSFGEDASLLKDYAWFGEESTGNAHEVQLKRPNPLDLYDMHGNVWEWVSDLYGDYAGGVFIDPFGPSAGQCWVWSGDKFVLSNSKNCQVVRGGSFFNPPGACAPPAGASATLSPGSGSTGSAACVSPPALAPWPLDFLDLLLSLSA